MKQWTTDRKTGKQFCSEKCWETTFPHCAACNKPMKQWTTDRETGKQFCSEKCWETSLPQCAACGKPIRKGTIDQKTGKQFCSEKCWETILDRCAICNNVMREWIVSDDKKYCSEKCFLESCPTCDVCGVHTETWIENDKGSKFCSNECRSSTLPICEVCGKHMENWLISKDNKTYCSEECYSHSLPKCSHCGRAMKKWFITKDGKIFCSEKCINENTGIMEKVNEFCNLTGVTETELNKLLVDNKWNLDDAMVHADTYMQSIEGKVAASVVVPASIKNAGIFEKLAKNLSAYNTNRGGPNGLKGFIFEDMHAANASLNGVPTEVLANNGIADFRILNPNGTYSLGQAKNVHNYVDWSPYRGQKIVIDKGNTKLIESARKAGMKVIESDISNADAESLANVMRLETKITGRPTAPITSGIHSLHQAGLNSAKIGGAVAAGFSLGSNIVDVATGDKKLGEASVAIATDTAIGTASSYVIGAGTTAFANTAIGATVIGNATAVGGAIAGTSAGASVIAAGTAVTTATSGAAAAVGGAIASTSVGASMIGAASAASATLGATAIGATIVAGAPFIAAGAAVGCIYKIGKKIFGRR